MYCQAVHSVLRTMQTIIFQYEGFVRQFLADDKVAVWILEWFGRPSYKRNSAGNGTYCCFWVAAALS